MKLKVVTLENKPAGEVSLDEGIFGLEPRKDILARMVNYQLAKRRAGAHAVKNRAEITGSSAKIYRQKGTGRARQGNGKAPQFRGGGRAFGPTPRDHAHALNKKVRKMALRHALSSKQKAGHLIIVDDLTVDDCRVGAVRQKLTNLGADNALLVGGSDLDRNFALATRNVPNLDLLPVQGANVYDILRRDMLILSKAAVEGLEARLK